MRVFTVTGAALQSQGAVLHVHRATAITTVPPLVTINWLPELAGPTVRLPELAQTELVPVTSTTLLALLVLPM